MQNINCTLYLIRHGQSYGNLTPNIIGQDPKTKLTSLGEQQASLLGKKFYKNNIKFDFIYSSTYTRALKTAEIVCEEIKENINSIILSEELKEYYPGKWAGKDKKDFLDQKVIEKLDKQNMHFKFPEGESYYQVERRISDWLEKSILFNKDFLSEKKHSNIALFSHGITLKCLLHYIIGFERSLLYKIRLDNTSVSIIKWDEQGWWVECINNISHLD